MQNSNESIEEICKVVEWYNNLKKDYTNINDLMYARKIICTQIFSLSMEMSKTRQSWKENEFTTESEKRKAMTKLLDDNLPVSKAIEYCKMEIINYVEAEKKAENEFHTIKFFIESANDVNNTLMQHISMLKKEQEINNQGVFK